MSRGFNYEKHNDIAVNLSRMWEYLMDLQSECKHAYGINATVLEEAHSAVYALDKMCEDMNLRVYEDCPDIADHAVYYSFRGSGNVGTHVRLRWERNYE